MGKTLYNDIEPFVCEWLRNLIDAGELPDGEVVCRPLQDLDPSELPETFHAFAGIGGWPLALKMAGWPEDVPVWTGSCPCQPFSNAGKGKGMEDDRHLWPVFREFINDGRPPILLGEQVASKAGREWLQRVRLDLEAMGYVVGASDLCSASVGSPDIRQRLYWGACLPTYPKSIYGYAHDCMEQSRSRRTPLATRRLPRVVVSGQWWKTSEGFERQPTLVPNHAGLSRILAGYGNAINPELAAIFVCEFMGAVSNG